MQMLRTIALIHLLLLHHSSIFQKYICMYIYIFQIYREFFVCVNKKKNSIESQVSFFSGDLNDFHAAREARLAAHFPQFFPRPVV